MTESEIRKILEERLQALEGRIQAACQRSGRLRESVTLVAVTKTVTNQVAGILPSLGVSNFGENRPQELKRKFQSLPGLGIRWHMIGHLQRNKVAETLPLVELIHSVDSPRLFQEICKEAQKQNRSTQFLFQVNGSREAAKHGYSYEELEKQLTEMPVGNPLKFCGYMTMAAYTEDPEACRATFRELKEFAYRHSPQPELSMGMSNDFEIAIEEGATLIRIGSVLFEGLPGPGEEA